MDLVALPDLVASMLATATGAGGVLLGAKMHLTKSQVDISGDRTAPDFDAAEADYAGYAAQVITWLAPSISDIGQSEIVGTVPEFRPTGTDPENICYQCYITNAAGDKLLLAGPLADGGVSMASPNDSLLVHPRVRPTATGATVIVS